MIRGKTEDKDMSFSRPMITGMLVVAAAALVPGTMLVGTAAAGRADRVEDTKPPAKAAPEFRFLAYENFAGKFHLNWKPVRLDDTHVSLTKNPGKLTITTQQGTIHADEKARNEPSAKNIFVIDNPLSKDVDFAVTTSVSSFTPAVAYQQAALIIYDDDDNYLKWSYEYNWRKQGGQTLCLVQETDTHVEHTNVDVDQPPQRIWLRLTKHDNEYAFASSTDGKAFTTHGKKQWGNGEPKSLGILAKNGGPAGVPELDACFDFFEVRALATTEADKEGAKE
jgi:regulation of enolase protein 1 (concanavalin A-like superfamily)